LLTSTAMFSIYDKDVYFGETAQWRNLVERGCIKDVACFEEIPTSVKGNYVFAGDGTPMKSQFCVAVTTGICYQGVTERAEKISCTDKIARITEELDVSNIAKKFQIPFDIPSDPIRNRLKKTSSARTSQQQRTQMNLPLNQLGKLSLPPDQPKKLSSPHGRVVLPNRVSTRKYRNNK